MSRNIDFIMKYPYFNYSTVQKYGFQSSTTQENINSCNVWPSVFNNPIPRCIGLKVGLLITKDPAYTRYVTERNWYIYVYRQNYGWENVGTVYVPEATQVYIDVEFTERTITKIVAVPSYLYLRFASCIYKYGFDNSILIYAQRPDSTMVADLQTWNKKVGRWVNRGAKSIAVFDTAAPKLELRYLFDVSDTNGTPDTYPRLWKLTEQNSIPLLEKLNVKFSLSAESLDEFVVTHTFNKLLEIVPDYYKGFNTVGSPLYDLDDDSQFESVICSFTNTIL